MTVPHVDGETTVTMPTTDETFSLLTNVYRRRLLVALLSESRVDTADLVPDPAAEVPTRLHHVHLPKLDEADFVDWNRERDVVARGERYGAVEPLVRMLAENPSKLPPGWV
ncbi:DUF7344 domain-containing protein [Halomarina rubra]|uniref:DUF7344 domain-containing protein n=1 Tax=Halomarina rubra TaxID=2071873 RepID=A0ABD6B1T7_9EURY|nr:hypothetical protein [Halomarina rubra]